ncbi:type II toxin-antitoxin system RnlB family antitoxin [Caballeronia sp. LjRoot29]|uniref:type II toxin-antitoxin system RnlB family antitoxin n=1 Tax=Caballeronia sp. LjRoot29 TaxID=3342315 RepID=UPI003F501D56
MTRTKSFSLIKGPSPAFPCIGFSLSSERPEAFLPKMEQELKRNAYHGRVLIDTLACNGISNRRFFVGEFDGETLVHSTLKIAPPSEIDADTQEFCRAFYANHHEVLERSVLSPFQKFKLSHPHPQLSR